MVEGSLATAEDLDSINTSFQFINILRIMSLVIWATLCVYSIIIYRMYMLNEKKSGARSMVKRSVLCALLSCSLYTISWIVFVGKDLELVNLGEHGGRASFILGGLAVGLTGFSIFTFTGIIIFALTLVKGGVKEARTDRSRRVQIYLKLGVIVPTLLIIGISLYAPTIGINTAGVYMFVVGIMYALLARTSLNLSKEEDTLQHGLAQTCEKFIWLAGVMACACILLSISQFVKAPHITLEDESILFYYLEWVQTPLFSFTMFTHLRFLSSTAKENHASINKNTLNRNSMCKKSFRTRCLFKDNSEDEDANLISTHVIDEDIGIIDIIDEVLPSDTRLRSDALINSDVNLSEDTGNPILDKDRNIIGMAPESPRPEWIPAVGPGLANVPPQRWSISIRNWTRFFLACFHTDTWEALAEAKGENNINMHDIIIHFVKPWTRGTGCSIATLLDHNQTEIETMVSHAYNGSVKETFPCVQSLVNLYFLPNDARIFFCTLCLYHCEDGADGGLMIQQQLDVKPFAKVIEMKPRYGMFIIHTTIAEVLDRLWCVHEVDEALLAEIKIYGVFDVHSWTRIEFDKIVDNVNTETAECQGQDRIMLTNLINTRGGFSRLDVAVRKVRKEGKKDLKIIHLFHEVFSVDLLSIG